MQETGHGCDIEAALAVLPGRRLQAAILVALCCVDASPATKNATMPAGVLGAN
jgi:hypothetical protein